MRVSREQAARNRAHTVHSALRAFRAHGFDGVSIADVMASAGLTHGGFYKNFESKAALELEATALGVERSVAAMGAAAESAPGTAASLGDAVEGSTITRRIAEAYLTEQHRDEPANGCAVAALAVDAGRSGVDVQRVLARGVVGMARQIARPVSKSDAATGEPPENGRPAVPDHALADVASLVGAIVLARAVREADPELSGRILSATIDHLDGASSAAHREGEET